MTSYDSRKRDRKDSWSFKKQKKLTRTADEDLESKLGFDLFSEGDTRLGWLLTFASSSWEDQETRKEYSCVDLYFVTQDGPSFKTKYKFRPYFYGSSWKPYNLSLIWGCLDSFSFPNQEEGFATRARIYDFNLAIAIQLYGLNNARSAHYANDKLLGGGKNLKGAQGKIGVSSYFRNVCGVLLIDQNVEHDVLVMRSNLLKYMHVRESAPEAQFCDPCPSLFLRNVIFSYCNDCRDLDICRDSALLAGQWRYAVRLCPNAGSLMTER